MFLPLSGSSSSIHLSLPPQDGRWWALFVGFFCGAGSGLVVINNVASIASSLGMVSSDLLVSEWERTDSRYEVLIMSVSSTTVSRDVAPSLVVRRPLFWSWG